MPSHAELDLIVQRTASRTLHEKNNLDERMSMVGDHVVFCLHDYTPLLFEYLRISFAAKPDSYALDGVHNHVEAHGPCIMFRRGLTPRPSTFLRKLSEQGQDALTDWLIAIADAEDSNRRQAYQALADLKADPSPDTLDQALSTCARYNSMVIDQFFDAAFYQERMKAAHDQLGIGLSPEEFIRLISNIVAPRSTQPYITLQYLDVLELAEMDLVGELTDRRFDAFRSYRGYCNATDLDDLGLYEPAALRGMLETTERCFGNLSRIFRFRLSLQEELRFGRLRANHDRWKFGQLFGASEEAMCLAGFAALACDYNEHHRYIKARFLMMMRRVYESRGIGLYAPLDEVNAIIGVEV